MQYITSNTVSSLTVCTKWMEEAVSWGWREEVEEGVQGKQTPHWADTFSSSWSVTSSFPSSSDIRYCCWVEQRGNVDINIIGWKKKTTSSNELWTMQYGWLFHKPQNHSVGLNLQIRIWMVYIQQFRNYFGAKSYLQRPVFFTSGNLDNNKHCRPTDSLLSVQLSGKLRIAVQIDKVITVTTIRY